MSRGAGEQATRAAALEALLGPPSWPASATREAPALDPDGLARAIHDRVNAVRAAHGLASLAWTDRLAEVALAHSRDMAEHAYFGHTNHRGEDPGDRARQVGLPDQVRVGNYLVEGIGENLFLTHRFRAYHVLQDASGDRYMFDWKTPQEIAREAVAGWMQSPAHRANLLSSLYHAAAVGVVHGSNEALFITQNFSCQAAIARAGRES